MKKILAASFSVLTNLVFCCLLAVSIGCSSSAVVEDSNSTLLGGGFKDSQSQLEPETTEEERFIKRQKAELEKQAKEIEDLKRQKYHDDYLRTRYPKEGSNAEKQPDGFGGY
jgi:hypothetical protein